MVENAKAFNQVASEIYDDAERLGKITASFMIKHNPAYNDKLYVAAPTPIPPGLTNGTTAEREEVALKAKSNSPAASAGAKAHRRQSAAVETPPEKQLQNGEEGQAHLDFTGKSLQQAQDIIITELIQHEDR